MVICGTPIVVEAFEGSDLLFAYSRNIPGLSVVARTADALRAELRAVIPALRAAQREGRAK